jgi:predicted metal-dependent hydrolase
MNLEYKIVFSERKNLTVTVERDRSVIVRAPEGTPPEKINALVEKKKFWIYQKTNHLQKYSEKQAPSDFVSGTSILYLGKTYRLESVKEEFEGIRFNRDFVVSKKNLSQAADLLREWYLKQARQIITPKVEYYTKNLGVNYNSVLISELKFRWGSCTPKNNLNFNWRLIKAPMRVVEYIIVHELAHLIEPNHNADFWKIIRAQLPHYQKSKEWLKEFGELLEN